MAAAASCSDITPREMYDVFLSFRGGDTRKTFTSHLYRALCQKKIRTYKDDEELESGDVISPALTKAISESKLRVIIFSENYASSAWCLEELVHILQCRDRKFVIPIFYGVDPSHVRRILGSYADAFVKHGERSPDKVRKWRDALTTAANISGFDSHDIRDESKLVETVVDDILKKLNRELSSCLEGKVGIEKQIREVESLLCLNSKDVQIVGIWGMGGIGKTTIAGAVFHHLSSKFEACCFIKLVREASETKLFKLRDYLFRTLLNEKDICITTPSIGPGFMRDRLRRTKALIVLDDVSEFSQLEFLARDNLFGPGSRILVTSRDKCIFRNGDEIYEVKKLDDDDALELFQSIAFGNMSPPGDYATSAKQVVHYAGGNPLALTTLGGVFCHCKSKEEWDGELERLKNCSNEKIQSVLRFSYDRLHGNERGIFLDIACFHRGKHIGEAKGILDASGFIVNAGVKRLIDMSLISVDKGFGLVEMHDLIQEMGWEIVREECYENPGKRSRLWLANEVCRLLKNNTGTKAIQCIAMNMGDLIRDFEVNASSFEKMPCLRLLDLYSDARGVNKVHLPPSFEFLPAALKYLRWHFYPLTSLPSRFSSEDLVELHMPNSQLERLWNEGVQINLGSLKRIDLRLSKHLTEVPDLSESTNLESICLRGCTSLVQLPSSFQRLAKLTRLDLDNCSNLKILSEMPGNLKALLLDRTAIEELPSSIWCLEKLNVLSLSSCEELKNLPSSICRLNSLRSLFLIGCSSLESLRPVELPSGLKDLHMRNCESLGSLPAQLPSGLRVLVLGSCKSLESLPVELPSGLIKLELICCNSLGSLPAELPPGLIELELICCHSLGSFPVELPSGLKKLRMKHFKSLESLPVELPSGLKELHLSNCESLGSLPIELPAGLRVLHLRNCKSLGSLPKLPWLLNHLDALGCTSLETVSTSMRTAPVQGWDQYVNDLKEILDEALEFINCLKLDQSAWCNIMADARLRVMRFATASPRFDAYDARTEGPRIVCPGNEIPKWLRHRSGGCSIKIELPPHSFRQGFLGYALCIVVAFNYTPPDNGYSHFSCKTHHKTNNDLKFCWEGLRIRLPDIPINSDHVFVWYFCPEFVGLESATNREDWVKASEASFDFKLYQHTAIWAAANRNLFDPSTVRVKSCGVSLLYAQEIEKLLGGIDEDEVMEPKQAVEEEDIIIKTKRRRDESEFSGNGSASFEEEDNNQLPPQSSKRKISIM